MKHIISIVLLVYAIWANDDNINDPGFEMYSSGYLNIINEDWSKSIKIFKELVVKHPKSEYADDATFWTAYSYKELGKYIDAFDTYFILLNKYPASNLTSKGINERIEIAKLLAEKNNIRFVNFLKSGGDISDELIQKYNKLKLYKSRIFDLEYQKDQLVSKMEMIELRSRTSRDNGFRVKTSNDNDRIFNNDRVNPEHVAKSALTTYYKIQTMDGEIQYHSNIVDATIDDIEIILDKFKPYLTEDDLINIVEEFNTINHEFYLAYKYIENKDWVNAKESYLTFIKNYPDHKLVQYAEFWLAYSYKENLEYSYAFKTFGSLVNKTSDKYIVEESKYNRIMIASSLARRGDESFVKFLEDGSDYKEELYNIFSELVKISDDKTKDELNRLFSVNTDELNKFIKTNKSNGELTNSYKTKLLNKLNFVAEKVKPYYGAYKINLIEIVK